jgi:hypothetical protein
MKKIGNDGTHASRLHGTRAATIAGTAAALVMLSSPARAGEYLQPAELTARAEAIALVDVALEPAKGKPAITVQGALRGSAAELKPAASWLSQCLPDRKELKRWLKRFPKSPERKHWEEAAAQPSYKAVVFLTEGPRGGALGPFCGVESMELLHTDLHPEYGSFLKRIEALAKSSTATGPREALP